MKSLQFCLLYAIACFLLVDLTAAVDVVKQLKGFKNQFLPAEYRSTNFTLDDLRKIFTTKCKKASDLPENSKLYEEIEKSAATFSTCLNDLFNVSAIQDEINAAIPTGELDTVFHNYCAKAPQAEQCFRDFNDMIQPCLTKTEQQQNRIMVRLASGLLGFMCTRGGDHLALFVAEEGPECLEANKEYIANCANESFSDLIKTTAPPSIADLYTLPELVLQPEHCIKLQNFEACTVQHLEECREVTPANLAESIFRYIRNGTSCKEWMENRVNKKSIWRESNNAELQSGKYILINTLISLLLTKMLNLSE